MNNPKPNGDDPEAAARREQRSKEARVRALLLIEETAELLREHVPPDKRTDWVTLFAKLLEVDEETRLTGSFFVGVPKNCDLRKLGIHKSLFLENHLKSKKWLFDI